MIPITEDQYRNLFRKWMGEHLDNFLYLDSYNILCSGGDFSNDIVAQEDGLYFIEHDSDALDKSKQDFFTTYSDTKKIDDFLEKIGIYDDLEDYFDGSGKKVMKFTEYVENYFLYDT